jgi:hypothetical protein
MDNFPDEEVTPVDHQYIMTDLTADEVVALEWLAAKSNVSYATIIGNLLHTALLRLREVMIEELAGTEPEELEEEVIRPPTAMYPTIKE